MMSWKLLYNRKQKRFKRLKPLNPLNLLKQSQGRLNIHKQSLKRLFKPLNQVFKRVRQV